MFSLLEIVKRSTDFLAQKKIENARLNAEILIGHVLGLNRMQLYIQFERPLTEAELDVIRPLLKRRANREPLQYIVGSVDFFGCKLKCDPRALIPRPETERLVEIVCKRLAEQPPESILDLGTGSGAIAIAFATHWPATRVVATDSSPVALALARENATTLGVDQRIVFIESNWYANPALSGEFSVLISNPPYLTEDEVRECEPEVRVHEPLQAVTPGGDGLQALDVIIAGATRYLKPDGWIALETGIAQHSAILTKLQHAGFTGAESLADLTGRPRFLLARRQ